MASSCSTCTLTQMDSGDCTENLYQSTYATSVEHVSRDSDSSEDGNTESDDSDDSDDSEDGRYIESETRDKPVIVDVPCFRNLRIDGFTLVLSLVDFTRHMLGLAWTLGGDGGKNTIPLINGADIVEFGHSPAAPYNRDETTYCDPDGMLNTLHDTLVDFSGTADHLVVLDTGHIFRKLVDTSTDLEEDLMNYACITIFNPVAPGACGESSILSSALPTIEIDAKGFRNMGNKAEYILQSTLTLLPYAGY